MSEQEPRGHVFPRWGPRGPFRVYSWLQASITGAGFAAASVMLVAGLMGPAAVLVAALGALALRDATGMPAWPRVGLGLQHLATRRRGAEPAGRGPGLLAGVELSGFELPHGVMGVVTDRGRYLAAMRVSPTRDPWLQSRADRDLAADDWARVVTALPTEYVDRLQILTVTRQGGGDDLLTDAASADGPGTEVLQQVAAHLAAHVRHTETVLVVRLDAKASRDTQHRGGAEAIGRLLYSTLQHLGVQLPTEQLQAEILAPADWAEIIHRILHPSQSHPNTRELPQRTDVNERWTTVDVNGHIHRLLWMWQWPLRPMTTGFLAPLLTGDGNRTVSLTIAPTDPEPHQRTLEFAYRRAEAAVHSSKGSKHRKQAQLDSLDRQLQELNQGHIPIQALITVAVTGNTLDDVEDLTGVVRANATAGACRLTTLSGTQAKTLGWILPLCRGLDRGLDP